MCVCNLMLNQIKKTSFTTQALFCFQRLAGKHFNNDVLTQRNNETSLSAEMLWFNFFPGFKCSGQCAGVISLTVFSGKMKIVKQNWLCFTRSYLKYETYYFRWSYQAVFKVVKTSSTITSCNIKVAFMHQSFRSSIFQIDLFCWQLEKCSMTDTTTGQADYPSIQRNICQNNHNMIVFFSTACSRSWYKTIIVRFVILGSEEFRTFFFSSLRM